jgi:cellulose synthase/poly-beta-1,6-N-acetylglucosamine synthase-like glycosyltransferase
VAISSDGKIKPGDARNVPIQLIFCMKERNQKKVSRVMSMQLTADQQSSVVLQVS